MLQLKIRSELRARFLERETARGFSLIELLVAIAVLSIMLLMLAEMTGTVADTWAKGEARIESYQSARAALELMTREMTPAVVDTRTQFVVMAGEDLVDVGAVNVSPNSPVILWMAPLGEQGDLRCVGYFLYRDDERQFYRLKRMYIKPDNEDDYFPLKQQVGDARRGERDYSTSPKDASWFLTNWDAPAFDEEDPGNDRVVVSTAADGVIAFWVQPLDLLGNPIPWVSESTPPHPSSELIYNSSGFFTMATSVPFEDGSSTKYLAEDFNVMRAIRVPAAVDVTVVTLDQRLLARRPSLPIQENILDSNGALDLAESVRLYNLALKAEGIQEARTFTTRVKLLNGS
ncbi:MAG: prepilin-type N-terminal cleavage/methylation domain-containing protein [Verrucomicrobiota bacterium]